MSIVKDLYDGFYKAGKQAKEDKLNKPKVEDKGFFHNSIKYSIASLPIIIPFVVTMLLSGNNIILSIISTIFFDVAILVLGAVYFFNNSDKMERYKK